MNIDGHSHFIPQSFIDNLKKDPEGLKAKLVEKDGVVHVAHDEGYVYPLSPAFYDLAARVDILEEKGLDMEVLSPAPPLFYYEAPPETARRVTAMINDGMAAAVKEDPAHFVGMAIAPMQDPPSAVQELKRVVREHGFRAVEIGAHVAGKPLDHPDLLPFFQTAGELGVVVFLHPYYVGAKPGLEDYYLTNFVGNPLETTVAAARLVYGGVLDQCPGLEICLAHGGGFFPYQIGRFSHGYEVREEPKVGGAGNPDRYLDRFYYDTVLFRPEALTFLVDVVGQDRVLMGTDFPFDMGEPDPVAFVRHNDRLTEENKECIAARNAQRIFGIRS